MHTCDWSKCRRCGDERGTRDVGRKGGMEDGYIWAPLRLKKCRCRHWLRTLDKFSELDLANIVEMTPQSATSHCIHVTSSFVVPILFLRHEMHINNSVFCAAYTVYELGVHYRHYTAYTKKTITLTSTCIFKQRLSKKFIYLVIYRERSCIVH